jgi:hypothetical protein
MKVAGWLAGVALVALWARGRAAEQSLELQSALARARVAEDRVARLSSRIEELEATMKQLVERCVPDHLRDEEDLETWEVESEGGVLPPPAPWEAHNAEMREEIIRLFKQERRRQRDAELNDAADELFASDRGPKQIDISCPTEPSVTISNLNDDEEEQGECLVLNLNAPDTEARLVIKCDGTIL